MILIVLIIENMLLYAQEIQMNSLGLISQLIKGGPSYIKSHRRPVGIIYFTVDSGNLFSPARC